MTIKNPEKFFRIVYEFNQFKVLIFICFIYKIITIAVFFFVIIKFIIKIIFEIAIYITKSSSKNAAAITDLPEPPDLLGAFKVHYRI
jgi:hypothetical protein